MAETEGRRSFPGWALFDSYIHRHEPDAFREDGEGRPSAEIRASNGELIRVSFRIAAPPRASCLFLHYPEGEREFYGTCLLRAHGDSILFRVAVPPAGDGRIPYRSSWFYNTDLFVCRATSSGPSLRPLPRCYVDDRTMAGEGSARYLHMLRPTDIGFLCCGGDQFTVADLKLLFSRESGVPPGVAELFRYHSQQWETKKLDIHCQEGRSQELIWWNTDITIPFGRYLCWVDYYRGIVFCDALKKNPKVWYANLPVVPPEGNPADPEFGRQYPHIVRTLCVTSSNAIKFIDIAHADGEISIRQRPGVPFTITVWSCSLEAVSSERVDWAKDFVMEPNEIWNAYREFQLPPLPLLLPFMSLEEPHMLYAVLKDTTNDPNGTWMLAIDTKNKTLNSAIPYNKVESFSYKVYGEMISKNVFRYMPLLPSKFSMYLNTHGSRKGKSGLRASVRGRQP